MRSGKPRKLWCHSVLFEEPRAVRLVLLPWPGQFVQMQNLAEVVRGRTEQNAVEITGKLREAVPHSVDDLSGSVMDEGEMGNQPGRCRKLLAKFSRNGR